MHEVAYSLVLCPCLFSLARYHVDGGVFQYYIKIVPTIYGDVDDKSIYSYQVRAVSLLRVCWFLLK